MKKAFDVIIVGAGSAGCVLANRLSINPHLNVLLIEAGGRDTKPEISIPAAFSKLYKTNIDWAFMTEPQLALGRRRLFWPRGKVLGGSSSINAMIYIRGNAKDYDAWAEMGNTDWSYDKVLPYFKRLETHPLGPSHFHGDRGPLNIEARRYTNPLSYAFIEAGEALGLRHNRDFNGRVQDGVGLFEVSQKHGKRHSAATAYLKPALKRPNLSVVTGAQVQRIFMDKTRAYALSYKKADTVTKLEAKGAIILSAGAVMSPALLMRSGIGPADHLRKHNIKLVANLPGVGKNLWDHLALPVTYRSKAAISLDQADNLRNLARYWLFQTGPLVSNIAEAGAFLKTEDGLGAPDLQLHFAPGYFVDHGFKREKGHFFSIGPTLIAPQSRGAIELASADPDVSPLIKPDYLKEKVDRDILHKGIAIAREFAKQPGFDAVRGEEVYPGKARLKKHIARFTESLYHPAGTCRMGQDALAVVDQDLLVHGFDNLYIVDASVMPTAIRGNTNVPTLMIAEKAAASFFRTLR